jgi:hypothetical protein
MYEHTTSTCLSPPLNPAAAESESKSDATARGMTPQPALKAASDGDSPIASELPLWKSFASRPSPSIVKVFPVPV